MQKFKMLNEIAANTVDKLAKKSLEVPEMDNAKLQKINEAIKTTVKMVKDELKLFEGALYEVNKVVEGEISKRGISARADKQLSMFDSLNGLEDKKKEA